MKDKKKDTGVIARLLQTQASQVSRDMSHWRQAKNEATRIENPRRVYLSDLVADMLHDTHLSSQMDLRLDRSLEKSWVIKNASDEVDEEVTAMLEESQTFHDLLREVLATAFHGHTLLEIAPSQTRLLDVAVVPRRHVVPQRGVLLRDVESPEGIAYRELHEYGRNVLEFGGSEDLGILFDCIPDTIFRRHSKASWSEFAEIYGIPPRTLKMDTMDEAAFSRAQQMMKAMGSANWAIIDLNEVLEFGGNVTDSGAIFQNLIQAAEQAISVKVAGAVIGLDTKNGNYSKEASSIGLLESKCMADRVRASRAINSVVIPALESLGIIKPGLRFEYVQESNTDAVFERTVKLLPYYDVDAEWLRNTFGVEVTERKQVADAPQLRAKLSKDDDPDFFG